ncbi:MAG: RagB/SusD family nutrient uptake outer membrane protein [Sediminibacterium sp.]
MQTKIFKIAFFILVINLFSSCKKDSEFLTEVRRDGLTVDNALVTKSQFDLALNSCYRQLQYFYNSTDGWTDFWHLGVNFDVAATTTLYIADPSAPWVDYTKINSQDAQSAKWWNWNYAIVKYANTVIAGVDGKNVTITADEKNLLLAEGKFLRAWAYRNLTIAFGGVPILAGPVTEPKVDFTRNTAAECYDFIKKDLEFARLNLPITTTITGKAVRSAADHLLAEIYIILKDYPSSIAAATRVIDGTDGAYSLMNTRFGARKAETMTTRGTPTDYYWDLHEINNTDYQMGNKEAIWVAQFERNVPGGGVAYPASGNWMIQGRAYWCRHWLFAKAGLAAAGASDSVGRGASFIRGTDYSNWFVWTNVNSTGDLRNNETNIRRKFYFGTDIAAAGGQPAFKKGDLIPASFLTTPGDSAWYIYPNWTKFGTDKHFGGDFVTGYTKDQYVMRLPETYLLRAEAYLAKGDAASALLDINTVRTRAQAPLAKLSDVTLDYILDERVRELYGEEYRMLTLMRLGLVYDRVKKYGGDIQKTTVGTKNNLLPIPQGEIDKNIGAKLAQNPGY